jgi:lipoyl(octanoyl) transferase
MASKVSTAKRLCRARYFGLVSYSEALALQNRLVDQRRRDEVPDQLLLLEHPHVFTLGRNADKGNIVGDSLQLDACSIEVHETGRGGDVTYHGPGQLVGYPIMNLRPERCDVHRYVRDLEEVMIKAAADFGVEASRISGLTGVWVKNEKLGAIGVRIARWITSHGFAFNVNTDLSFFSLIVPCGIRDKGVTSLSRLLGTEIEMPKVIDSVIRHFGEIFDREVTGEDEVLT